MNQLVRALQELRMKHDAACKKEVLPEEPKRVDDIDEEDTKKTKKAALMLPSWVYRSTPPTDGQGAGTWNTFRQSWPGATWKTFQQAIGMSMGERELMAWIPPTHSETPPSGGWQGKWWSSVQSSNPRWSGSGGWGQFRKDFGPLFSRMKYSASEHELRTNNPERRGYLESHPKGHSRYTGPKTRQGGSAAMGLAPPTSSPWDPVKFRAVFQEADAAGRAAADAHVPTPMIVEQRANPLDDTSPVITRYPPVMGGVSGFAWVKVFPKKDVKLRNLLKSAGFRKAYGGGMDLWIGAYGQSMEKKEAYASAYAQVLQRAGINAFPGSRMD